MSRIVDNISLTLSDVLNGVLPYSSRLDACVGYFNLRGWRSLRDSIGQMQPDGSEESQGSTVRLLVGMAVSTDQLVRQDLEKGTQRIDHTLALRRADQAVLGFAKQLTWGTPTSFDEAGLRVLRKDLENGLLTVKFAAREPLHAKLYVARLVGGLRAFHAVVGSSNFTAAGLSKQGELSLEETDAELTAQLAQWFQDRWDDQYSMDITKQLIEVLEESWIRETQPRPYLVYLRLAYELSRDARAGLTLDIPSDVRRLLMPHQESAVRVATKLLQRKGIAVIGDVVGLGKTLTGTAIAATTGESVLVIAPKNLTQTWQEHLERFHIPGRVISLSMVAKELPDLKRFRLVLIDESHNLRNRQRKAWDAIHTYVDDNDCKVVLLTATMFNARHEDIGGQLGLKIPLDQPLGVRPERHIATVGAQALAARTNGRLDTLAAFEQSEFNEDWQRLLSEFLVRRTRRFLESTYGVTDPKTGHTTLSFPNGESFRFPKRIPEALNYQGGPQDPNDRLATEEVFESVVGLSFACYQLGAYLVDDVVALDKEEEELINDLRRSVQTAAGFIRTTAFKRLTSSAHAFILTITRMIARNAVLDYALSQRLQVPMGSFSYGFFDVNDDDDIDDSQEEAVPTGVNWSTTQWQGNAQQAYEALDASNPKGLRWARPGLFKSHEVLSKVRADSEVLQGLLNRYGTWHPDQDTKLRALADLIEGLPPDEKVLVFSEYKDTVDYLAKYLPDYTDRSLASVSGQSSDPLRVARRFAPRANEDIGGLPSGETEVDVLITTDVLSEGQNLQDARIVVNWDLPWTIIKIIQRAGRVDRIKQKAETIRVLSFLPQGGVEEQINLRRRLVKRLKNAQQILGGDERFFDDDDSSVDISGLFDGTADLGEEEGEVDASSFALGIWEQASEDDRREALDLQEIVYSTKVIDEGNPYVLTYGRTDAGTDLLVRTTQSDLSFITPMEALQEMVSEVFETASPTLGDHLQHIGRAVDAMGEQVAKNTVLLHTGLRKRLYDFLTKQSQRIDLPTPINAQMCQVIDAVTANPIREDVKLEVSGILRQVRHLGDDSGLHRLLALHEEHALIDVRDYGADRVQVITGMGFNPVAISSREKSPHYDQ
ncbi:MAG: phospholipase D-like domain-containing protein [Propionibacteriaceae bacterium]|jgi:superfamily II DNA or RNA helicase|nr:phospholipase D-like domain-containing protein [Propionibacteriaceae bacterium]